MTSGYTIVQNMMSLCNNMKIMPQLKRELMKCILALYCMTKMQAKVPLPWKQSPIVLYLLSHLVPASELRVDRRSCLVWIIFIALRTLTASGDIELWTNEGSKWVVAWVKLALLERSARRNASALSSASCCSRACWRISCVWWACWSIRIVASTSTSRFSPFSSDVVDEWCCALDASVGNEGNWDNLGNLRGWAGEVWMDPLEL